jgi:hypothetical protein
MDQNKEEEIKNRKRIRMESLCRTWINIANRLDVADKRLFELNLSIAIKVVTHYSDDLEILKERYGIDELAEAPKVAGLMASAILKYRPIVPKVCLQECIEDTHINEILAIYHGICICASYNEIGIGNAPMARLMLSPYFLKWYGRMLYLVKERNYTSEALIAIFETLCLAAFPDGMTIEAESK